MKKKIGISRSNSKFHNYVNWVEQTGYLFEILDWEKSNLDDIRNCSSLLLTGGADIFPEFYSDWDDGKNRNDYIPARDGFEFGLLDYALYKKMPILAVCRGMQLVNCRLNGSLLSDIETIRGVNHRKISDNEDRYHQVKVKDGTLLMEIIGEQMGNINSSHHQGIDRIGEGLVISARAVDGIIEGLEWENKDGKPFLLTVQWHPERMKDMSSPFSKNIMERFLEETDKS
jgi:putative glutamine amidotransferase